MREELEALKQKHATVCRIASTNRDWVVEELRDLGLEIEALISRIEMKEGRPMNEPSKERMLRHFQYKHLPEHLHEVSRRWCELANHVVDTLPRNPERTVALRKLLEGKDCAVRAMLEGEQER